MKNCMYAMTIVLSVFASSGIVPVVAQTINKTVKIDTGTIEGIASNNVLSFKGIPYAAPPVGNLRWRAPQLVQPWRGVRKAIAYGNDCIQKPFPGDAAASGSKTSEDCLVLNVWRPANNLSRKKLPVLVWIHGGGFLNGSSAAKIFDGSAFAQQGLVVVSFNYRLGRLGFFAHPALTAAKEGPLGNYGLLDQLAALRWVQRNVAAFGGDPNQVTLMGESAGGISVMQHLTSPQAKGLFHRAIVLSGGGRSLLIGLRKLSDRTSKLPSAEESGIEFARSVGIKETGAAALKALRALPAETVNGSLSMAALLEKTPSYAGGLIFDGSLVTANPGELLQQGKAANVPLLIGTTSADIPLAFPPSNNPLSYFGVDAKKASLLYNPSGKLPLRTLITSIGADMAMHEPARFVAQQMTLAKNPAWLYRFGYVAASLSPKQMGAEHASELPYLFNTLDARYGKAVTPKDREMARMFHTYFANFAKSGDPNGQGLSTWAKYDPAKSNIMTFTPNGDSVMKVDPWKERLNLVERAADGQNQSLNATGNLRNTSWQLVKFQGSDEKVLIPKDKAKYTIAFAAQDRVSVRIDCNRGSGTWQSPAPNQLRFGLLALTRAFCPPDALNNRIVKDLSLVRSYTIKNGHLFLSLMADGGIYEFEPMSKSQPAVPK